jgi:sulfite reductase (NADPH) hemoprotein beta-component
MPEEKKLSEVEHIKTNSNLLRGTLLDSLAVEVTGSIAADDTQLIKFHGSYQQHDRDLESERKRQKLEPLYSFMIRIRVPGGVVSAEQWLRLDELSWQHANGTLKLTTRQAIQLHGVLKRDLQKTIQGFNQVLMDSFAGCGDVNRNVMCNPNPSQSRVHAQAHEDAAAISAHLTPKTNAYHEIWLKAEEVEGTEETIKVAASPIQNEEEPIYGRTYLPRKFKIAIAIPPYNDTDIYSNDIGLIAIEKNGELIGYNIVAGGGLGMTFGMPETYPRLASRLGFVNRKNLLKAVESIVTIQRDWGNRENRKLSRMKYTIDKVGLEVFTEELEKRMGFKLEANAPYLFTRSGDVFGWSQNVDGTHNVLLFIEGGRVKDTDSYLLKTALRKVAEIHDGDFLLTGNQNLMIRHISEKNKLVIQLLLEHYKVLPELNKTGLRLNSIACVALPTCSLAFAEAERYLPDLITKIDKILEENHLEKEEIIIRMTGCPNGCGRPYLGEIGLVGKSVGRYNLYLGASFKGERLNKLYKEMLDEEGILQELRPIITRYAQERFEDERFGDFTIRKGYVKATTHGLNFHA